MRGHLRRFGQLAAVLGLAGLGVFAVSPLASADGPLPTITTVTASVPDVTAPGAGTVVGTTVTVTAIGNGLASTVTTTTPGSTAPNPGAGGSGKGGSGTTGSGQAGSRSSDAVGTSAAKTSAIKLANGLVSVSAASVRPPVRLLIDRISYSPDVLRRPGRLTVSLRVRDSLRHVVRGAVIFLRSSKLRPAASVTTRIDGSAKVSIAITRSAVHRRGTLGLLVGAATPTVSTYRTVRVPVNP